MPILGNNTSMQWAKARVRPLWERACPSAKALVHRWHGMMLVRNTPVAIDFAQSDRQPEQEAFLLNRGAEAGAAAHDGNGESNVYACRNRQFLDVERL
jgi:hypothetical protein